MISSMRLRNSGRKWPRSTSMTPALVFSYSSPAAPRAFQPSLDDVRTQVGRSDDDGVGEIHHPALAVGEATVVEHLQQDVVYVRVCLLDLVEQQHAVGACAAPSR